MIGPRLLRGRQQGVALGFVLGCLTVTQLQLLYQSHLQTAAWLRQSNMRKEVPTTSSAATKNTIVAAKEEAPATLYPLVVAGICDAPNDAAVLEKPCRPRMVTLKLKQSTNVAEILAAFPRVRNSQWTTLHLEQHVGVPSFLMEILDPQTDNFISGSILRGKGFDMHVLHVIANSLREGATRRKKNVSTSVSNHTSNNQRTPVMVDVGGNIGFFTLAALACGARTFTFEPMRSNVGTMLRSIERNAGFRDRATLFHNAVHYIPSKVYMETTNKEMNLSNGAIQKSEPGQCRETRSNNTDAGLYGVDYMETVTLDQIFLQYLDPGDIVDVMKMDIESYEAVAINGGLRFLCRNIVRVIVMEVAYLNFNKMCSGEAMFELFKNLGYTAWTVPEPGKISKDETVLAWANMGQNDLSFRLENPEISPLERMQGDPSSPCKNFE